MLTAGTGFYELPSNSDAIDAAVGTYSFLTQDILEGTRPAAYDAGAEEFGANGTRSPFTTSDVGETVGFGTSMFSAPSLAASTSSLEFNKGANSKTFTVLTEQNWQITENITWLSLSANSGNGNTEITVTVTENTTGADRTGTISITDTDGENLSASIAITQTNEIFNPNDAEEITALTVTGVGTQDPNIPENTVDNNTDTRWSANATDGSAYLTYTFGCNYNFTDVSIFFHKSTQRTTTVSIATSLDGVNFTDVYTEVESTMLASEDYEDFDMNKRRS